MNKKHEKYMAEALRLAKISADLGEVPVGALVVVNDEVVGLGINRRELRNSCVEHAEINAIIDASEKLGRWRLTGAVVYSTLEPCIMCAQALVHARINTLVYGPADPKFGGIESLYNISKDPRLNHQFATISGIMAEQSAQLLRDFFKNLRQKKQKI